MARYRNKDEVDLTWNRIRRRLTRELDTEIQNAREAALNQLLSKAWDDYTEAIGTGTVPDAAIDRAIRQVFDLTPRGIMQALDLRKPIYLRTAAYGHFGRAVEAGTNGSAELTYFPWERTDRADALRDAAR